MKILRWMDTAFARLEGWLIIVFLWLMIILTFIQIFLRSLYTHLHLHWANTVMGYLDWSEPFVRLLVLWLTFLGASLITKEKKHIKIDLFSALLPSKWLPAREFLLSVVCVLISAIMLKVSIDYINLEIEFGGSTFLALPNWIGQLILPLGFALILFRFLLRAINLGVKAARDMSK